MIELIHETGLKNFLIFGAIAGIVSQVLVDDELFKIVLALLAGIMGTIVHIKFGRLSLARDDGRPNLF